jgi:hypothetical protein
MTAHEACPNYVHLAGEVARDEGENFLREAIDGDERVPPLAYRRQSGRSLSVNSGDRTKGEAVSNGWRL